MEFQGVIRSSRPYALTSVEETLGCRLPGISFAWTVSGQEKLAALEAKGVDVPTLVRQVLMAQRPSRCGSWSNNLIEVAINLGSDDQVDCIWLTVSGDDRSGNKLLETFRGIGWSPESPEEIEVTEVGAEDEINLTGHATLFVERPSGADREDPQ